MTDSIINSIALFATVLVFAALILRVSFAIRATKKVPTSDRQEGSPKIKLGLMNDPNVLQLRSGYSFRQPENFDGIKALPDAVNPIMTFEHHRWDMQSPQISATNTYMAIDSLCSFVRASEAKYIVGVNRGGTALAAMVALKLNIGSHNFFKCYSGKKGIICEDDGLLGTVILIDDIIRTGETLKRVHKYFSEKYGEDLKIVTATLVSVIDSNGVSPYKHLDFSIVETNNLNFRLPWKRNKLSARSQFKAVQSTPIKEIADSTANEISKQFLASESL